MVFRAGKGTRDLIQLSSFTDKARGIDLPKFTQWMNGLTFAHLNYSILGIRWGMDCQCPHSLFFLKWALKFLTIHIFSSTIVAHTALLSTIQSFLKISNYNSASLSTTVLTVNFSKRKESFVHWCCTCFLRFSKGMWFFFFFFLAALGLRCCMRTFSSCCQQGLLFIAVRGLLIAVASLVAEYGL